jgi:serine/threonine-protein kinase
MRASPCPHARKPLRLLALGGATLVDSGGAVVAEQRRRLALLVLIAAGRGKGVSRDKLISYLNPESSTESARHALHQLLYYIRQQAGEDVLIGTDPLRMNPDVVTSDVSEFEDALDRGDLNAGVALYRGPFLDGFHIPDSVQFEEWSAAERARLAARNTDALFQLASAADARNDYAGAIGWWTKLAALDSLSARSATGLIQAYAAAGDVPAALRHAAVHNSVVRSELGTEPDATSAAVTAALHTPRPPATRLEREAESITDPPAPPPPPPPPPAPAPAPAPQASPARRRGPGTALIALALVATAAAAVLGLTRSRHDPVTSRGLVAIMPFRVTAADSATMWLREGLVDLLSIRLADDRGRGAIDPRVSIASWARAGGATGGDAPQLAVLAAARQLGASHVITGSAVVSGSEVLISADLIAVASGRTVAEVEARGRVDSVVQLIDTIAVRFVSIQGGEDMLRAGGLGATSVPAVRSYLDGRAALRVGDWVAAVDAFERALAFDSTFASAALGLREASGLVNGLRAAYAESLAWRYQDRLTPRERSTFRAELGPNHPAWYPAADRLKAWRAVTSSDFANADAWRELGLTYYHNGARIGAPNALSEARIALEQSLDLDATQGFTSRMQLLAIAAVTADSALYDRVVRGEPVASTDTATLVYRRWLRAFTRRDSLAVIAARPRLADASDNDLTSIWSLTQKAGWDVQDADRAQAIIAARARTSHEQPAVASIQYHLALNRGRPTEAHSFAPRLMPEWRPLSRLALEVLSALYGDGDDRAGSAAANQLVSEVERPLARDAAELRSQMIHVCVSAQWSLAHGETRMVDRALTKLRTPEPGAVGSIVAFYETCAATIAAWRSVVEHRPDSRALLTRLDSLLLTGTPWHWALPEYRVAARLWEMTGDRVRAVAAIRRRRIDITNYLAADLGEEGRLALAAGDTAGAVTAWRHYLALRSDPEPTLRAEAAHVRRQTDLLSASLTSSHGR